NARISARMQRLQSDAGIELLIDVAHNPQAARELAHWLDANRPTGRCIAVFGALADKDVAAIAALLDGCIDAWLLAGLDGELARGLDVEQLHQRCADVISQPMHGHSEVLNALDAALAMARAGDRIVAFG